MSIHYKIISKTTCLHQQKEHLSFQNTDDKTELHQTWPLTWHDPLTWPTCMLIISRLQTTLHHSMRVAHLCLKLCRLTAWWYWTGRLKTHKIYSTSQIWYLTSWCSSAINTDSPVWYYDAQVTRLSNFEMLGIRRWKAWKRQIFFDSCGISERYRFVTHFFGW